MQGKNVIIAILVVALIALGLLFWKNNQNNSQVNSEASSEMKLPVAETDTNSPSQQIPEVEKPTEFNESFAESNWLLESAVTEGKKVDLSINVPAPLTLNFDKDKKTYNGFSGCNNFSGSYSAKAPNSFSFGATISTKKGCVETGTLETQLFKAMSEVTMFEIVDGKLTLTSKDGQTKLTYSKAI